MISAHLPPGTEIECINARIGAYRVPGKKYRDSLDGLQMDFRYTVRDYTFSWASGLPCVRLNELRRPLFLGIEPGFHLSRFRVVQVPDLPAEILSCLNVDPEQARVLMPEDA